MSDSDIWHVVQITDRIRFLQMNCRRDEVFLNRHNAKDRLNRSAASGLLERGEFKTYYSLLSENLRRFLEESLAVEAMEQTTSELADALQGAEVEGAIRQQITDYLAAADLVKFARFHPALDAARCAPDAGLAILRAIEEAVASRAVEAHAEHPV